MNTRTMNPSLMSTWAKSIVGDTNAVFLDTETCGVQPTSELCDIGIVAVDGTVLLDQLVRPDGPIPAGASRVHGIYDHHVADAPHWSEIAAQVYALLHGKRVIVYNSAYDSAILHNAYLRTRLAPPLASWECAMVAFSRFIGVSRWQKLDVAAAHFQIPPGGHRAKADAETARQVVYGMAGVISYPRDIPTGGEA